MNRIWTALKSFFWWNYERGSIPYDIMVTLILLFVFLAPLKINFKDKPVERAPHPTRVVLIPDGGSGYIYQVDATAVKGSDDAAIRTGLQRVIEPIAGEVEIAKYEPVRDPSGRVVAYKVWLEK
jgi:hypothetical protein